MNIVIHLSREENISKYQAEEISIDIEEYLKGVVPSEIGNAALEACKAQAVVARTFGLSRIRNRGYITDKSSIDQAFRASRISSAYPNALQAVESTAGEVLYYNNSLVASCVYSASNGGRIRSSAEVWGGNRDYLVSKDDPYDTKIKNGHGVGMSQAGAKKMAELGFTYKDILAFYYPGTELRAHYGEKELVPVAEKTKVQIVIAWAYSKLDPQCGYIWGTAGQICTQALIDSKHKQYPEYVDPSIVSKWIGKQVFDCQGFVQQAMKQVGIKMVSGANSQWLKTNFVEKGTIDTLPKDKVCCLYRYDSAKKRMGHTGLYLGDGQTFIHASGSKTGVVKSTLNEYNRWTHWGIPAGLYDENNIKPEVIKVVYQAKVQLKTGSTVNMRSGASTSSSIITRIAAGQIVDVTSVSNDWAKISWNGKSGYMMNQYLTKVEGSENNKVWYVRLECDSEAQAKAIASILASAKATT